MSQPGSDPLPIVDPSAPPCRHLRNKGMYVYTDDTALTPHDDYDNTIYWCFHTMGGWGPDDEMVTGDDCRCTSRTCYEAL